MFEEIQDKWKEWYDVPFPREAHEFEEQDLVSIDAFSAGFISVYVERGGKLDQKRITSLRQCTRDLDACLCQLSGETREYFERLLSLARMVLYSVEATSPKT